MEKKPDTLARASGASFGLGWAGIIVGAIVFPPLAVVGAWMAIAGMAGGAACVARDKGKAIGRAEAEEEARERDEEKRA